MKSQLLCTFSDAEEVELILNKIESLYNVLFNFIYVLEDSDNPDNLFITYNVDSDGGEFSHIENTILLHRKKETNTLYTINALNLAIQADNHGILDKRYKLNWENYRNSILLTSQTGLRQVRTKINKVVKII